METTEWICSNCGTTNNSKFCSNCGTQRPAANDSTVWICNECGQENTGKFCSQCGREKSRNEASSSGTVRSDLERTQPMPSIRPSGTPSTPLSQNTAVNPLPDSSWQNSSADFSPPPSSTNKPLYLGIAIVALLILSGIGGYYFFSSQQPAATNNTHTQTQTQETNPKPQAESTSHAPTAKSSINSDSDFGLGKVALGDTLDKVHEKLGQEITREARENGRTVYVYKDVNVIVNNGIVTTLESNSELFATKLGVHQGSSLSDVLAVYKQ
ncbi:MAG: hypothetical protein IKO94_01675, partial [Selenomonadaceae bacterium]|nr:hypothetical protein [Selenomonadaceae bacterium]